MGGCSHPFPPPPTPNPWGGNQAPSRQWGWSEPQGLGWVQCTQRPLSLQPLCTVLCDPIPSSPPPPPPTPPCAPPGGGVGIPLLRGWCFSPGGHKRGFSEPLICVLHHLHPDVCNSGGGPRAPSQSQDCCWGCVMGSGRSPTSTCSEEQYLWVPERSAVAVQLSGFPFSCTVRTLPGGTAGQHLWG